MSHKIEVAGNYGSVQALKDTLNEQKIAFKEEKEGNDTFLSVPSWVAYGNNARIYTSGETARCTVDYIHQGKVQEVYRDAMARHVKQRLLVDGHSVSSETRVGQNIVLRVAVG